MSRPSPTVPSDGYLAGAFESPGTRNATRTASRWLGLLLDRVARHRIFLSQIIFGATFLAEILFVRSRPRDILAIDQWPTLLGEISLFLGLAIRSWAAGTLHKQRQLTRSGPYALLRHPLYLGSFLMMVGVLTLLNSLLAMVVLLLAIPLLYSAAVRDEERVMAGIYPEDWPAYCRQTPRFLPRLGTWPEMAQWSAAQWVANHEHHAVLGTFGALIGLWFWRQLT